MASLRKIEANKSNASRSTGPRTPGGKLRSSNNARRHGLATRLEDNHEERARIECLAAILSEGVNDFSRAEQPRIVAECYFDLRRIRAARYDIFLTMSDLENANGNDFEIAMRAMDRISRYEKRALSKRKQALSKSSD